jgi:hypothetical protein
MPNDIKSITGSESFRKRNPALFGLGAVGVSQPKPDAGGTLVSNQQAQARGKGSVEAGPLLRIELIRCGERILDSDNLSMSFKPLRDALARSLECDDGQPCIQWAYSQAQTTGRQGTIVRMEILT